MFKPIETYEIERRILICDYIRYSPSEISTINTPNGHFNINILKEESVISLINSYLDLTFEVIKKAEISRYADGNDLVNLGPIALFSKFKLTISSDKHLKFIIHAHIIPLMNKLITSGRGSVDLSIGFDRDRGRRRHEFTYTNNIRGKCHVRIMLKDVFGFAEHQEKASYGLGYKLTLTRSKDGAVLDKAPGITDAGIKLVNIQWYVPHYTPSIPQQGILSKQILSKTPKVLRYFETSVFMKEVNNQNLWNFELGSHEGINVPLWIIVGLQQKDREDSQNLNNDTFCRVPVTCAQCIIGTEKYPDGNIKLLR